MATKEQVEAMLEKMKATRPYHFFQRLDETQAGTGAVLFLLYDANGTVSAGQISDSLKISTEKNGDKRADYKRTWHSRCPCNHCKTNRSWITNDTKYASSYVSTNGTHPRQNWRGTFAGIF